MNLMTRMFLSLSLLAGSTAMTAVSASAMDRMENETMQKESSMMAPNKMERMEHKTMEKKDSMERMEHKTMEKKDSMKRMESNH